MPWRTCLQRADECGDKKVCITCNAADNMRKNKDTIFDAANAVARMWKGIESEIKEGLEVEDYNKVMINWLANWSFGTCFAHALHPYFKRSRFKM